MALPFYDWLRTLAYKQVFELQRPISQPESWPWLGLVPATRNLSMCAGSALVEMQISCGFSGFPGGMWQTQTFVLLPFPQAAST